MKRAPRPLNEVDGLVAGEDVEGFEVVDILAAVGSSLLTARSLPSGAERCEKERKKEEKADIAQTADLHGWVRMSARTASRLWTLCQDVHHQRIHSPFISPQ